MWLVIVLCVALIRAFSIEVGDCIIPGRTGHQPDYYWREYVGIVPEDAVEGGYTEAGNKSYIGHFRHQSQIAILSGNIYAGRKEVISTMGGTTTHSLYILILCSGHKERFEWKETSIESLHLLADYHLVKGGVFNESILHIGRANVDDQVKVGDIYPNTHPWRGLWVYSGKNSQVNLLKFQILVYTR